MDLREVTDELYALPHAEFTAARTEYVKAAKAEGQREMATKIGKLRRPTVAAWLINQLVRGQPGELKRLADLGTRLRAAHHNVDGAAIRDLSRERQGLIGSLVAGSRDVGRSAGQPVSDAVVRELEEMFTAALADADAAGALASGRLTTAKDLVDGVPSWPESDPSGEPVSQLARATQRPSRPGAGRHGSDEPAGRHRADEPAGRHGSDGGKGGDAPSKVASLAEARRNKARAELERLDSELADAERTGQDALDAADTATDEETDARNAVARLRAELSDAERAEKEARESARTARRAHEDAERVVREVRKRRDVAASRLAALGEE